MQYIQENAVKAIVQYDGCILLLQRSRPYTDLHSTKLWWDLPGGLISQNEDQVFALIRELREETALVLHSYSLLPFTNKSYHHVGYETVRHYYVCNSSNVVKLSSEHISHSWISYDNLHNYAVEPASHEALLHFVNTK
jgi:8-oxo-dGTP pyrophosphatase MutT (NUDIX family)